VNAKLTLRCCIASALLLQGCAMRSAPPELLVHPALQVRHSSNETAEAYYQLGRLHQGQGNLDTALAGYTYAIARDPQHMAARNAAAAIHAQQGRLDQARAMMLAVIADTPGASQAHNNLGYIDYLRGDHASAARAMRMALSLDPHNERARNNLKLVETALAMAPVSQATPPMATPAAPQLVAAPAAAPAPAPQVALVQVVPNVYELTLPKPAAPVLATALPALPGARLEVANGNGKPGLARRVGAMLGQHGFPVVRLSNQRPYGERTTRIEYRAGYMQQAEALRVLIDGPVLLAPVETLAARADLRVVLGHDSRSAMAAPDAMAPTLAAR
jgi:Flp pilus assembly protein TadD